MYLVKDIIGDILNLIFMKGEIQGFNIVRLCDNMIDWTVLCKNEDCVGGILEANEYVEIKDLRELIFKAIEDCDDSFVRPYQISDLFADMDPDEIAAARELARKEGQELCNDFVEKAVEDCFVEDDDLTDEVTIFSTKEPHIVHKEG